MDSSKKQALLAEIQKRKELKEAANQQLLFNFEDFCFKPQVEFFRGSGPRFRTAVCSRRAGKTVGIVADMIDTCTNNPGSLCLYLTITKQNARNIIWADIIKVIEDYKLNCKLDNTRLSVRFPNGSKIAIEGVKDRTEIEKYRGWKLKKCYIDECQSFKPYLKELIKDVITPALRDLRGSLYLTGTPGPVPAGTFFEYSQNKNWSAHHWTAFDNPHMHNPPKLDLELTLEEERMLFEIDENDPGYQRETYGVWVEDLDSLVFKFRKDNNTYEKLPEEGAWYYIFGIDIGFEDADAICVLGYNTYEKKVYLVEEDVVRKQDITSLVERIKDLKDLYNPIKMVMDAGALGKKIQEELNLRHGLVIDAAEKSRKVEFIELLNDDLRRGKFAAFKNSIFEDDCARVQWDRESKIRNPERPKISTVYHSDICDAVLYAWRECRHYLSEKPEERATVGTDKYMDDLEQKEAEKVQFRKDNPDWELYESFEEDAEALQEMMDDFDF
jgi:PBSX family phage terminase large subunit